MNAPFLRRRYSKTGDKFQIGQTVQKQERDLRNFRALNLLHTKLVSIASCNLQRMAEQINKSSGLAAELTSVNMLGKVKN